MLDILSRDYVDKAVKIARQIELFGPQCLRCGRRNCGCLRSIK